jgi:hypothetical protein
MEESWGEWRTACLARYNVAFVLLFVPWKICGVMCTSKVLQGNFYHSFSSRPARDGVWSHLHPFHQANSIAYANLEVVSMVNCWRIGEPTHRWSSSEIHFLRPSTDFNQGAMSIGDWLAKAKERFAVFVLCQETTHDDGRGG